MRKYIYNLWKSDSEAYKCFYLFFLISIISSEMLVTNWKLVTGMIGNQLNHSKIIELHCGYALQPLKSDSAYKCFIWFFLISIISPEMLVTNWKLVTGMIGNQLNHSKIIELHCGNALQPLKSDSEAYKCFYLIFPHFDHISWNVSHKLKISNRNDRESTKPLKKS